MGPAASSSIVNDNDLELKPVLLITFDVSLISFVYGESIPAAAAPSFVILGKFAYAVPTFSPPLPPATPSASLCIKSVSR